MIPSNIAAMLRTTFLSSSTRLAAIFTRNMSTRSYGDALEHLNSLQSNAATIAKGCIKPEFAMPRMQEYLGRIGYQPQNLNPLNVIHIAGTKGKGSTCAFTESILRHTRPDWKIGFYSSPHIIAVRERIRINGSPISEDKFTKYFFEVWDRLFKAQGTGTPSIPPMPAYFSFLTLMAYHVFLEEKVNATVVEVGLGGTYDCTNIVPQPVVTGVTALGFDHVKLLGNTIEEIAGQKAGIFKPSVPALTVDQPPGAIPVLKSRALELKAKDFTIVPNNPRLSNIKLGLSGDHQRQNASLAIALARNFLSTTTSDFVDDDALPDSFRLGLENAKWPGRCQTVPDHNRPNFTWYLDGAHTTESLERGLEWFVSPGVGLPTGSQEIHGRTVRVLVFNVTAGRPGGPFLKLIRKTIGLRQSSFGYNPETEFFDHVIFCTTVTYSNGKFKGDLFSTQTDTADLTTREHASDWTALAPAFPQSHIHVLSSIEDAVKRLESLESQFNLPLQIFVTGSLHLVGGVVEVAGLADSAL